MAHKKYVIFQIFSTIQFNFAPPSLAAVASLETSCENWVHTLFILGNVIER